MYNELLCNELCSQIGMPCAEYESAHFEEDDGVVSYNIIKKGETLQSLDEFAYGTPDGEINLEALSVVFDEYIQDGYKINKKQAIIDLYRIAVFDYLTLQTDRNDGNINMVYNSKNKSYKVAPLFDNEFAFGTKQFLDLDRGFPYTIKQLEKECSMNQYVFSMEEFDGHQYMKVHKNMQTMVKYAKKDPEFKQILVDILKKIDVQKAIEKMESQGHQVNEEYKKMVIELVEYTKEMIKDEFKKSTTKHDFFTLLQKYFFHLKKVLIFFIFLINITLFC